MEKGIRNGRNVGEGGRNGERRRKIREKEEKRNGGRGGRNGDIKEKEREWKKGEGRGKRRKEWG